MSSVALLLPFKWLKTEILFTKWLLEWRKVRYYSLYDRQSQVVAQKMKLTTLYNTFQCFFIAIVLTKSKSHKSPRSEKCNHS